MDRSLRNMYKSAFDGRVYLDTSYNLFDGSPSAYPFIRLDKLNFELDIFKHGAIHGRRLLEIGCGPTIDFIIVPCPYFDEIYMADINEGSRREIELWREGSLKAFDWSGFFKHIMNLEGNGNFWEERQAEVKSKIKAVLPCDVLLENPLAPNQPDSFDCVITSTCVPVACASEEELFAAMENVTRLVKPGGDFLSFAVFGSTRYSVAGNIFPVLKIDENLHKHAIEKAGLFINTTITKYLDNKIRAKCDHVADIKGYTMVHAVKLT